MRVNNIKPYNDVQNTNFTSLRITRDYVFGKWPRTTLEEFVKNKEVQTFVKIMHNKDKDVLATYFCNRFNDFNKEIHINLTNHTLQRNDIQFNYVIPENAIKYFSAKEAVKAYEKSVNESILNEQELKNAMDFVEKFNNSLMQNDKLKTAK